MPWRPRYYMLDAKGQPVPTDDVLEWGTWFEQSADQRIVARDRNEGKDHKEIWVSTVFLGLDHGFSLDDDAPPVLWETMVFGGPLDGEMDRYTSLADALIGHQQMCVRVQNALPRKHAPSSGPQPTTPCVPSGWPTKRKRHGRPIQYQILK